VTNSQLINTAELFASQFNVSRETIDRLTIYEVLLRQWQKGTNLVSLKTLDEIWHRHFADSAQLITLAPDSVKWLDLGSGAGFPGLVIAICLANREDAHVHIVESNARKCAFCHEVVRETGCSVEIHCDRIESLWQDDRFSGVEIITSRALSPLNELLALAAPFFTDGTTGLFLKGRNAASELEEAKTNWAFDVQMYPSITDEQANIVQVSRLQNESVRNVEAAND
jgi:16S rRNA (guanine527-N7)-methyltransferase